MESLSKQRFYCPLVVDHQSEVKLCAEFPSCHWHDRAIQANCSFCQANFGDYERVVAQQIVRRLLVILTFLLVARSTTRANPPDYLSNDHEPAVRASELASPFTEFVTEQPPSRLGTFSSEPFFRYAEFSLQPRLYYRSFRNNSGLQEAFAAGGSLSFTTGWWRDTLQLGLTGYTTQPVVTSNGAGNTGLLGPNGDGFSVLGQAWAKVKAGPATATLFRQALQLPFLNGNDSRMIPNTFEAYQLEVEPWNIFRLNFGYVAGMKARTSGREILWHRNYLRLFQARTRRRQGIWRLCLWQHARWSLGRRDQRDR